MIRNILFFLVFFSFLSCSGPKKEPKLRLGYDSGYFSLNTQTARMKGFIEELSFLIAKKTGFELELLTASSDILIDLLEKREIDSVFWDMNKNIVNQSRYTFSEPILYNGYYLVTQKNDNRTLPELTHRRVLLLNNEIATVLIAKYPNVDFNFYDDDKDAFVKLTQSMCSAALVPVESFRTFESEFHVQGKPVNDQYFYFISGLDSKMGEKVNRCVDLFHRDGTIEGLKKKWDLDPG
jgi:ABC-type amino acid transport substrate-binding protein